MMRNPKLRAVLAGAGACALLTGCMTVGPDFHTPTLQAPDSYAQAGDEPNGAGQQARVGEKVVGDWWTLFQSPALDQIMRQAIANSPSLEQARAKLAQARDAGGAQGGLLTSDMSAGAKRERLNLNSFGFSPPAGAGFTFPTNPELNLYSIGATVSYNLDLFGGKRRLRETLAAQSETQARELDAAYLTLTGNVVKQVLTMGDANNQIIALQAIADDDRRDLDMIIKAQKAGGATAADVAAAEGQMAMDLSKIPDQKQRWSVARHALAVLVGKAPSEYAPPNFDSSSGVLPLDLPASLPSEIIHQRPDILEAEAKLHAATAEVGVATANLYPNITLNASLSQDALTPESIFKTTSTSWALGAGLTAPLFHSGELHARKREAEDAARAAYAGYQETVLEAFAQVDDVLQSIAHDNQTFAEQTKALKAAQERLGMAREAFAAGGISARQLLASEQALQRVQLSLQEQGTGRYADAALLLLAVAGVPKGAAEGVETAAK